MADYDPNESGIANLGISISDGSEASGLGLRLSLNTSQSHSQSQSRLTGSQQLFQSRGSVPAAAPVAAGHGFIQPGMGGIGVVVADSVYFCGEREANHLPNVQLRRVSAFLAVAKEVQMPTFVKQADLETGAAAFEKLDMHDDHTTLLRRHFAKAFRFLDRCRSEGHRVIIYCRQGQSRSASIAAAYVMRERKCNFVEALDHLRQTRKADPNFLFCQQLDAFAKEGHATSLSSSMAPTPQVMTIHSQPQQQQSSSPQSQQQQQQQHQQQNCSSGANGNQQPSEDVSVASVATNGGDTQSTPKGNSGASRGRISAEVDHQRASGSPGMAPKVSPPAHHPPLPSFLVGCGAFSVSVGDGPGLISFHSLDPNEHHQMPQVGFTGGLTHNAAQTSAPILPYGRPGMVAAAVSGASASQEASGPLAVPDSGNPLISGDTSSQAPPTVASTAGGGNHHHNLSYMLEASLLTNPAADDDQDDLIPTQDSRRTSCTTEAMGASALTALPPLASSSRGGHALEVPSMRGAAANNNVADDEPNFTRAHDILADSGVIGADGQLLLDIHNLGYGADDDVD